MPLPIYFDTTQSTQIMKSNTLLIILFAQFCSIYAFSQQVKKGTIDRKAVVTRHNLQLTDPNLPGPTQVGNGDFAYGFDITGMQTFNDQFTTMSQWSWHSTKPPHGLDPATFKQTLVKTHERLVPYDLPNPAQPALSKWLARNPHRFNLGRIGLILKKEDGSLAKITDLESPSQELNLWNGVATSHFMIEGKKVKVITSCDADKDIIGFKIESTLIPQNRLSIFIQFPYASLEYFSNGSDYTKPDAHKTTLSMTGKNTALFHRQLDSTRYEVACHWTGDGSVKKIAPHKFILDPTGSETTVNFTFSFSPEKINDPAPSFATVKKSSIRGWESFWQSGGAIDLSQSKDLRWFELERRIILSEYLMAINAAGNYPPQETGLVSNSWYGRFHYEMYWWHEAHYSLWDRWPLLNNSLHVYADNLTSSMHRAALQGYSGARWPKCTGPDGREWPYDTHAYLIWQQPHPLFFAELDYRAHPTTETLKKWDKIVEQTADFMASYAYYDKKKKEYVLGPPIKSVPENNEPLTVENPAFELSYWRFGLKIAQEWRKRLHLQAKEKWATVLNQLAPIPEKDGVYEQWESIDSMWTKYNYEHPAMTGIFGMLPGDGVNKKTMARTFQKVLDSWQFDRCWGWDFPMMAMCAARLDRPKDAVDMLLHPSKKFNFDAHGLVGGGNPYPYFPSNGGLLYAVAMMTAGWDGDNGVSEPGWPKDGSWVVKWEDLKPAP